MSLSENIDWDTVLSESLDDPSILDSTDEHKLSNRLHKVSNRWPNTGAKRLGRPSARIALDW